MSSMRQPDSILGLVEIMVNIGIKCIQENKLQ